MKITVAVGVGEGVSVLTVGVIVGLGVREGMDAAVCVLAASTVCAINVLAAPGSIVGTDGVTSDGAHAMISASAVTQINNFDLRVAVIVTSSTSDSNSEYRLRLLLFNDDGYIGEAQLTFYYERHDISAFLCGSDGIKVNGKLRARF